MTDDTTRNTSEPTIIDDVPQSVLDALRGRDPALGWKALVLAAGERAAMLVTPPNRAGVTLAKITQFLTDHGHNEEAQKLTDAMLALAEAERDQGVLIGVGLCHTWPPGFETFETWPLAALRYAGIPIEPSALPDDDEEEECAED